MKRRILVFGAGVIGSLYACLFAQAGADVTVYARGRRLELLQNRGLQYEKKGRVFTAPVRISDSLDPETEYDFILLTVKENQVHQALLELKDTKSDTIVTMVNTLESYGSWEKECGEGRILPAFPGAGGSIEDGVLRAKLTPGFIQKTTFAEKDGTKSGRVLEFAALLRKAGIPHQIVKDMHAWQLCHLAMVVPLADAYYEAEDPVHAGSEKCVMRRTASRIKKNLKQLSSAGVKLSPGKMFLLRDTPEGLFARILAVVYKSRFAETFMYAHSMKAPDEMRDLHDMFYAHLEKM